MSKLVMTISCSTGESITTDLNDVELNRLVYLIEIANMLNVISKAKFHINLNEVKGDK